MRAHCESWFMVCFNELAYLKHQVHNYGSKFMVHTCELGCLKMDQNLWSTFMNLIKIFIFLVTQVQKYRSQPISVALNLGSFCRKNPREDWFTTLDQSHWSILVYFRQKINGEDLLKFNSKISIHLNVQNHYFFKFQFNGKVCWFMKITYFAKYVCYF